MEPSLREELEIAVYKSGHSCSKCGDALLHTDEVYLLQVVQPYVDEQLEFAPIISTDDDFLYEPIFLDFMCWEKVEEEIREAVENVPPILDTYGILDCSLCESSIRQWEVMGLATYGELHCSQRTPEGSPTSTFKQMDNLPTVLCISCLKKMNADILEVWESVSHGGECDEGTFFRCWRHGCPANGCLTGAPTEK